LTEVPSRVWRLEVRGDDEDLDRAHDLFESCGAPTDLAKTSESQS
jgi:hypothetical protein